MAAGKRITLYPDEKLDKGIISVADYKYGGPNMVMRKLFIL